jgi:hypothetical protein
MNKKALSSTVRVARCRNSKSNAQSQIQLLSQQLQRMMDIERHHIISISNHDKNDLDLFRTWVDWCPKYEAIPGARGGKGLLHHVCRKCRKVCFHLLDKADGVQQRVCLGCWRRCHDQSLLPKWYYHHSHDCKICKAKSMRR